MKKLIYTFLVFTSLVLTNLNAQITVEVGDTLKGIIEAAPDGSEIIIKSGSHKAAYNTIEIVDKSLIIRGEEGAPKPKVYIKSFSVSGTDISLTLDGIEFSGATYDSLTGIEDTITLKGEYLINLTDAFVSGNNLTIEDCIVRNFQRSVIRGDRSPAHHVNNILVDNCIVFDLRGGGSYGPFRLKSNITFDDFTIQNSTFHHVQGPILDCQNMENYAANFLINHCTFYKWGGVITDKYLFDINSNSSASLTIKNSILAQTNNDDLTDVYGFRIGAIAYKELSFSVMTPDFSVDDSTYAMVEWNKSDFTQEDYEVNFEYPDTSNFTIPYPDDLYEMSEMGTLIGDPRWGDTPSAVHDFLNTRDFFVYPNPAHHELNILNAGTGKIEIFCVSGVKLDEFELHNSTVLTFKISDYIPGLYIIRLNGTTTKSVFIE